MSNIGSMLQHFGNLKEFNEFLAQLVEKTADGQEIARGMSPNDKSKDEKSEESAPQPPIQQEPQQAAEAGAPPEGAGAAIDPVAAPGSQVSIGKKVKDTIHTQPKATKVEVKGDKTPKVNMKPSVIIDKNNLR